MKQHIQWLKQQLPELVESEVIDQPSAERLAAHYEPVEAQAAAGSSSMITIILASIGALLIGSGIILIFAHNWEELGRPARAALAFAPLVLAQILIVLALFRPPEGQKARSKTWREAAGVLLFCAVPASIALIGQTYHLSNDTQAFLTWWFCLVIPFVFWLRSSFTAVLMTILAATLCVMYGSPYWLTLAALFGYLLILHAEQPTIEAGWVGWSFVIASAVGIPAVLFHDNPSWSVMLALLASATVYYLGGHLLEGSRGFWKRPLVVSGAIGLGIMGLALTDSHVSGLSEFYYGQDRARPLAVLLFEIALVVAAFGLTIYTAVKKHFQALPLASLLVIEALFWLLPEGDYLRVLPSVIYHLAVIAIGVLFIYWGGRDENTGQLNFGLLLLMLLIIIRFFDSDVSFVIKGVAFILMGASFIGVNIWHSRRRRNS